MTHAAILVVAGSLLLLAGCADPEVAAPGPSASASPTAVAPAGSRPSPASRPPAPSPSPTPGRGSPSPSPASPTPEPIPDPDVTPATAAALAADLVAAESAIRDARTPPRRLQAWAELQQARYRQLAAQPGWHETVVSAAPADLREAVTQNLRATVELRALTSPRESLPAWRIVAPPPPEELLEHYRAAGAEFGIDWTYLAAIHLVETRMGRIRGVSVAGARGPMQFLPSTWDAYGDGDIEDARDAIRAAARYLAAHGAPNDMHGALWAYNHSDRYVTAVSDHAAVMRADERAYLAYHAWRVYYRLTCRDVVLPVGWDHTAVPGDPCA